MRISDWSSDVCSSDLRLRRTFQMGFGCRSPPPIGGMKSEVEPTRLAAAREVPAVRRAGDANRTGGERSRHEAAAARSEEHTSELQSLMRSSYAVFCLQTKQICNTYDNSCRTERINLM